MGDGCALRQVQRYDAVAAIGSGERLGVVVGCGVGVALPGVRAAERGVELVGDNRFYGHVPCYKAIATVDGFKGVYKAGRGVIDISFPGVFLTEGVIVVNVFVFRVYD